MDNSSQLIVLLGVLLLASSLFGGCFSSLQEEGHPRIAWPSELHPEFFLPNGNLTTDRNSIITYYSSHTWLPGGGGVNYYGVEATLDVYNFDLEHGQASAAAIWIVNRGDGHPSSLCAIQFGWHIFPWLYKDSHTHFYTAWMSGGASGKGCMNMNCPGFHNSSSIIAPGHVISPVSHVGDQKSNITLRIFKEKYSGDWHIHFGPSGDSEPVGYFPKSLIPGLIDNPVEISFGGYVAHRKPRLSPPMGSGYIAYNENAAFFSNLKLIDQDGNDYTIDKDLPYTTDMKGCYNPSVIDSAQFFYGGPGCID
uniref:Uncharacterized protein n=1 Tax=Avena sativa TaxID=4498 RepID=A0ACD5TXK1_AVESA